MMKPASENWSRLDQITGYSVAGYGTSKNAEPASSTVTRRYYNTQQNNTGSSYNTPQESSHVNVVRYTYNQPQGFNKSGFTIPSQDPSMNLSYGNNTLNQNSSVSLNAPSIDPRMFTLPPPPPPAAPSVAYSTTTTLSPGQYVYNPFSVPPPPITGPIMTMQYATTNPQQEIYHPPQFQRPNITRFSNRGGYYNNIVKKRKTAQEMELETTKRAPRKKKKPLSQNIPSRRDWSVEDAKKALEVEKEFNKRHKSQSLIIKFPDLELNRDIVSRFHPMISSVHFQQPSTPRFCFVTLRDSSNIEDVIKELSKIRFGDGYLTAEPKKDREEDLNIGPEDIDPLTLYVGNLAQEVTVDDVVKAYPKNKRIDIGFAKKMKYTRYAFISFRTVDDAILAFQNTHATEMYNKSLIVRFRRLHGTVGLPGEPKPQNHQKRSETTDNSDTVQEGSASNNCPLPIKEEIPSTAYNYESDEDEYDEEDLYCDNMRNVVRNSLGAEAATIKSEPLDYDMENYYQSYMPNNDGSYVALNDSHVPLLEPKTEDLANPIIIKDESEDLVQRDYDRSLRMARKNSIFEDGDYDVGDHNNDPLWCA